MVNYSVANTTPISVSNTEVLISSILPFQQNTLVIGSSIRIKMFGTLDQSSQYSLNVRLGANGNVTDAAIFNSNNIVTRSTLLSDLNNWQMANPGFTPNEYSFPANNVNAPAITRTPTILNGDLLLIVTGVGTNGNIAIVSPFTTIDKTNLMASFGSGVLAIANGINTTINNSICVTMSMVGPGGYNFTPPGTEGPGSNWSYTQSANTTNTTIALSVIELLTTFNGATVATNQSLNSAAITSGTAGPPFANNDSRVLLDIGISALNPRNLWTNLPAGFSYTSAIGSSLDNVTGYVPGAGGNSAGRITSTNALGSTFGAQGTVYLRVARAALCQDQSLSTTSVWYDSLGNPVANSSSNFNPVLFTFSNSNTTNYAVFATAFNGSYFRLTNALGNQAGPVLFNPQSPLYTSPNYDPVYADVIVTWGPYNYGGVSGTQCFVYVDGIPVWDFVESPATVAGCFYYFSIGNWSSGPSSVLGGNLGPYAIQRIQLSNAFFPPPILPVLVGFYGDSFTAGGGVGGDGGAPGTATIASIAAANFINGIVPRSVSNTSTFFQNGTGTSAQWAWQSILQAYCYKQLGAYFPAFGSCKSGYSGMFTGYGSPIDNFSANVTFTGAFASGATGGTLANAATWPYPTGNGWSLTFSNGDVRPIGAVTKGVTTTLTWAALSSTAGAGANVNYTTYSDALNSAQPQIVVHWDSVNNLYEAPNSTGVGLTPVADAQTRFDYWANGNPKLKAIIFAETASLELLPANYGGSITPAQVKTLAANFRSQHRAAFYNQTYYAGLRKVPVIYVKTHEQWAGAPDGNLMTWGSNPNNPTTTGSVQGPTGTSPNIHPSPQGSIRIADLIWPALQNTLLSIPWNDSGLQYNGGNTGSTVQPNYAQGVNQVWTMTANTTVGIPLNVSQVGSLLSLTFVQDSVGSRTITFNPTYRNSPNISAGAAGLRATTRFEFDGVNWQYLGGSTTFA